MFKYRAEITKSEDIRYISHLDYANVFVKAILRAKLPAAYSEGFNPHMKIAFASALSLGVSSDAEYMEFELTKEVCQPELFDKLNDNLPPGIRVLRLKEVKVKTAALMAQADLAGYDIKIPYGGEFTEAENIIAEFNKAETAIYQRITPKKKREIEVKQYMNKPVMVRENSGMLLIDMSIKITETGSVKPSEILLVLKDQFGLNINEHQALIHRNSLTGKGKALIDLV